MDSVWIAGRDQWEPFAPLAGRIEADTVVVGGGITGISTALRLADAGQQVVVLEAGQIGASNTGYSTGNLYGTLSGGLAQVRRKWSDEVTRDVANLRMQAVNWVQDTAARLEIDCAFARRPLYSGVTGDDTAQIEKLEEEFDALELVGLSPQWLDRMPGLPIPMRRVLHIEGQAQFDPYCYTRALAAVLSKRGVRLFEDTAVVDVDASEGKVVTAGGEARGRHIVFATHTPIGFNLVQAEMEVLREYGISARLASTEPPQGIFWVQDQTRSFRHHDLDGNRYLVVVGEKHKTGEPEPGVDYYRRLRDTVCEHFGAADFEHAWSAQQFKPADALPYIGRSAHDNVLIATGFAADGLTWGTVAARMLSDLIQNQESEASELLSPRRFTPGKSGKIWLSENKTVIKHLVGDRLSPAEVQRLSDIGAGEGRIVELDGRKFAAYRSEAGALSVVSPVCTHLGCHVAWNPHARSWDCPCHGSRFDTSGDVIEGPALRPLLSKLP